MHDGLLPDEIRRALAEEVDVANVRRCAIAHVHDNAPDELDRALAAWEAAARESDRADEIRKAKQALVAALERNDRRAAQAARDRWKACLPRTEAQPQTPQVQDVGAMLLEPDVTPRWLCQAFGWLPGAPHLVAGYGGGGKTWALQAAAVAVATGRTIWGYYPCRRGKALHVDFEMDSLVARSRYRRILRGMGEPEIQGLAYLRAEASGPSALLLEESQADRWARLFDGYDLVIVDSLRVATCQMDENDSRIRGALDLLGRVSAQTGATVVVVHHARKAAAGEADARFTVRGSSAIFDACASVLALAAQRGEPTVVHHAKNRNDVTTEDFALSLRDVRSGVDDRWGITITTSGVEAVTLARAAALRPKIRRALADAGPDGLTTSALREAIGSRAEDTIGALAAMVADGNVSRSPGPRNAQIYRLREGGHGGP